MISIKAVADSNLEWVFEREAVGRALIDFGQIVSQPLYWSYEKLALELIQPKDGRIWQIFKRCVAAFCFALIGIATFLGAAVGGLIRMGGAYVLGKPYYYVKGEAKEQWNPSEISLFSFNACMYESGLPMLLGGVMPGSHRIERLAQLLLKTPSDAIFLQELSLGNALKLIPHLKAEYPHFYTNIGNPTAWIDSKVVGPELFVALKSPLVSEPKFIPFADSEASHKLGFFCLETPTCWLIQAHFPEKRQEIQLRQIAEESQRLKATTGKPCILAGDLNYRVPIPADLFHDPNKDPKETCSLLLQARMFGKGDPAQAYEDDDFILLDRESWEAKEAEFSKFEILELEHSTDPWRALSDHKPVRATVCFTISSSQKQPFRDP